MYRKCSYLIVGWILFAAQILVAGPLARLSQVGDQPIQSTVDLAWSPDSRHAYVVTRDGLALMERRSDSTLRTIATYRGGEGGLPPFSAPQRVTLSPDGRHVYFATSGALLLFERQLGNGRLSFVAMYEDGRAGILGLSFIHQVAVTPDGLQVLVASSADEGYLEVFRRDPTTGSLDFVRNSIVGQNGTDGTAALVQTADGRHVYASTLAGSTLTHLERRPAAARLRVLRTYRSSSDFQSRMSNPLDMVLSPNEDFLYVLATNTQAVVVLARDTNSGALSFVEAVPPLGEPPVLTFANSLSLTPDGRHLYVTQFDTERVAQFERLGDGRLSYLGFYSGSGLGLSQNQRLVLGPQGQFAYFLSFQGPGAVLSRDLANGLLNYSGPLIPPQEHMIDGLQDPLDMALSADGRHLYVAGRNDDAIVALGLHRGQLDQVPIDIERQDDGGVQALRQVASLALSPDGRHLYATGTDGDIDGFQRHDASGALQWSHFWPGVLGGINLSANSDLLFDSDGEHLYLASSGDSSLGVLKRNSEDGHLETLQSLSERDGVEGIEFPQALVLSPDEQFLYVANFSGSIGIFERSPQTGLLTPREESRFSPASDLAISDDGRFLYSTHFFPPNNLSIYQRDLSDGSLTLLRRISSEGPDLLPIGGASHLALDPSQQRLYVTSFEDNALLTFDRDPILGDVTFLGAEINSTFNVTGLFKPFDVAVAEDGTVLVSSLGEDSVTSFTSQCADNHLCLMASRFRVEVAYRDFDGTESVATALATPSDESAVLWFFQEDNWEMLVKLVDGCTINDHVWVFASAVTNIETVLRVTDTWSGITAEYTNPLGQSPRAVTDVQALPTCSMIPP